MHDYRTKGCVLFAVVQQRGPDRGSSASSMMQKRSSVLMITPPCRDEEEEEILCVKPKVRPACASQRATRPAAGAR